MTFITPINIAFDLIEAKKQLKILLEKHPLIHRKLYLTELPKNKFSQHTIIDRGTHDTIIIDNEEHAIDSNHYTELSPIIRGTIFEDIVLQLRQKQRIGKVKFVMIPPKYIYKWHYDHNDNIHIPLISEKCAIIHNDRVYWFEEGKTYYCNTLGNEHTAFNASEFTDRIHILAAAHCDRSVPYMKDKNYINWDKNKII